MRNDTRFFIDRGVGSRIVPEGLRAAGWDVVTMDERYGLQRSQAVDDTEWITDASTRGEILITKDRNITKHPFEVEAIVGAGARVLVIASGNITGADSLDHLLANAGRIERAIEVVGPWALAVYAKRLGPIRLNLR